MTDERQDENPIEIKDLTTYLKEISELRQEMLESGDNKRLFSRGQENIVWDICPTVFRDSLLKDEAEMVKRAYARNPYEFKDHIFPFERLTKLQHYGLSTRLLDVTLNPMVALYFACQECNEIEKELDAEGKENSKMVSRNGVVYCQLGYGYSFDCLEVRILSAISEMDMENLTLKSCLGKLEEDGTLSKNHVAAYQKNDYREFIKILQGNYFVISNFSNERLIRQSGAFLLPGCINIIKDDEKIDASIIQKAKDNLQSEFTSRIFEIPTDAKADILDELDMYNINEASLFPELEHQMRYIKSLHMNSTSGMIDTFSKITSNAVVDNTLGITEKRSNPHKQHEESEKLKEIIRNSLDGKIPNGVSNEEIFKIFEDNMSVDWYKKNQRISKIRIEINHNLRNSGKYTFGDSKRLANEIVKNVILDIKEWMETDE